MSTQTPGLIDRLRAYDPERYARRLAPAGAALCLIGAALANWLGVLLALAGLTLLLISCLSRDDGLLVLGPFARWELVRMATRRRPPALWRALYATGVLLILVGNVWTYIPHAIGLRANLQPYDAMKMQYVGQQVFNWIMVCQYVFVWYYTVHLFAPLVAEEREGKRLDFLLVTDLRNREILIGKALGRVPQLLDPILASLPVLAVLPLLGGIPPAFVIGAAVALLATALGLTGLSFFCSIISPTGRKAIDTVYGLCFVYILFSGVLWGLALIPIAWGFPSSLGVRSPVDVSDIVIVVNSGNPLTVVVHILEEIQGGADTESTILTAVKRYTLFQMAVLAVFGLMAVARLRWVKVSDPTAKPTESESLIRELLRPIFYRPAVTDEPLAWHERYRTTRLRRPPDERKQLIRAFVIGGGLVCLAHIVPLFIPSPAPELPRVLVGVMVWGIGLIVLLGSLTHGVATVARERENGTLDALMLTGLGCREILRQKWRGCVTVFIPLYVSLLGLMTAGVVTNTLNLPTMLMIAFTTPIHAALGASLGLVFTVRAKSINRAGWTMWGSIVGIAWIVSMLIAVVARGSAGSDKLGLFAIVLTPPAATGTMLFALTDEMQTPQRYLESLGMLACAIAGTVFYAFIGAGLFRLAVRRFEREWEGRA